MRMIKAFAAVAAMIFMVACSNEQQAAAPATTTVTPGSVADFRQNVGDRVFFDTDMSNIREDGRQTLNRQAEWLKKYTNYPITIEGHCDERGTREYNLALGERRANAAKQYLIAQGACRRRASRPSATARSVRIRSAPTRLHGRATAVRSPSCSKGVTAARCVGIFDDAGRPRPAFSFGGRAAMPENGRV